MAEEAKNESIKQKTVGTCHQEYTKDGRKIFGRSPSKEEMDRALELRHTKEVQDKIRRATVAVCGLGGLGSNIAFALARCGVGKLHLIDFDCVDVANLNRQQYRASQVGMPKPLALQEELLEVNPYLDISTDWVKLTEENIPGILKADTYICEAFDVPEAKAMLTNTVLERLQGKFLVGASGMAGYGDSNSIRTRKILPNYYLCGDGVSDVHTCGGLMAPRVMLCASHQANQILELIINNG